MVFFVLIGFFIHLPAATAIAGGRDDRFDVQRYAIRRAHCLMPPYAPTLLLTLALDMIGRGIYPDLYYSRTGDAFNSPLWSIAYEVVYYAVYPAWLAVRRFAGLSAYPIAALGAAIADGFASTAALFWPVWLCGAALAEWLAKGQVPKRDAWMFFAVAGTALAPHHAELGSWWRAACVAILGGAMVAGTAIAGAAFRFPSATAAIAWLARIGRRRCGGGRGRRGLLAGRAALYASPVPVTGQ